LTSKRLEQRIKWAQKEYKQTGEWYAWYERGNQWR
jgi:hypothetical protein